MTSKWAGVCLLTCIFMARANAEIDLKPADLQPEENAKVWKLIEGIPDQINGRIYAVADDDYQKRFRFVNRLTGKFEDLQLLGDAVWAQPFYVESKDKSITLTMYRSVKFKDGKLLYLGISDENYWTYREGRNWSQSRAWTDRASNYVENLFGEFSLDRLRNRAIILTVTPTEIIVAHEWQSSKDLIKTTGRYGGHFQAVISPEDRSAFSETNYRLDADDIQPNRHYKKIYSVLSYPIKSGAFDPTGAIRLAYVGDHDRISPKGPYSFQYGNFAFWSGCDELLMSYERLNMHTRSWLQEFPNKNPYCLENRLGPKQRPLDWISFYPEGRLKEFSAKPMSTTESADICVQANRKMEQAARSIDAYYLDAANGSYRFSNSRAVPRGTSTALREVVNKFIGKYGALKNQCSLDIEMFLRHAETGIQETERLEKIGMSMGIR